MFFVSDSLTGRQDLIRSFVGKQATLGALLSVVDFEWTVRRAIISLGFEPTKQVRADIDRCSGAVAYKDKWRKHIVPRFGTSLESVVPDWDALKDRSFKMRHKIVHGVNVNAKEQEAIENREIALKASAAVCDFALDRGFDLYMKLKIRVKPVEIAK